MPFEASSAVSSPTNTENDMSKQSDAKLAQNYQPKGPTCAGCNNLQSEKVLLSWQITQNESLAKIKKADRWTLAEHGIEKNIRCGIGWFAVRKQGCCDLWEALK